MAKDDISLGVEMGRLEIEPVKTNKNIKEENPFVNGAAPPQARAVYSRTCIQNVKCSCSVQKKSKNVSICKKKHSKILKEPILTFLQCHHHNGENQKYVKKCLSPFNVKSENLNLCALVKNCNQLKISSDCTERASVAVEVNLESRWWENDSSSVRQSRETGPASSPAAAGSCSQQVRNPPCDVTIDELASYFETLVHIPKKMSSMAEMMYI